MSVRTNDRFTSLADVDRVRLVATAGVGLTLLAFLGVLQRISVIAGDPDTFLLLAVGALVAATLLARYLSAGPALALTAAMVVAGAYLYLQTLPDGVAILAAQGGHLLQDTFVLLQGLSVLRIVNAGVWALAVTPGPVFLAWYFAIRKRYVAGATVAGLALSLFVLTGDAKAPLVLLGVVGVATAIGFGELDRRGGSLAAGDAIAVTLAAMIVLSLTLSVIPAAGRSGGGGGFGRGDTGTVEASLLNAGNEIAIQGTISLSPETRFTIESNEGGYWRVGSYDRYTGQGWIRTGGNEAYDEPLRSPPDDYRTIRQRVETEADANVMPALWKPREVLEAPVDVRVTADQSFEPSRSIAEGERYTVTSRVSSVAPRELRETGTDYPAHIRELYMQVPSTTPDRVGDRTERITANADNPYDTARVVEQWLQRNKRYSLDVDRPDGNIADTFLFEMDSGYCTYYATTMVTMLRTQGIPARFVVGYTPGQRVAEDRWVVRGLDAHAWVEVYFPEYGWVQFDPTPAGPRLDAEQGAIEDARAANDTQVDTNESANGTWTPEPTTPIPATPAGNQTARTPNLGGFGENLGTDTAGNGSTPPGGVDVGSPGGGFSLPELPPREQLALGAVVLIGLLAGLRRAGLTERVYRELWLRYQPRGEPGEDIERAFERLEYLRGQEGRPRRSGETPRQFVADADSRVRRVGELYERARYAGRADRAAADEAVSLVDELVGERPLRSR
jgi:transglutaminase-like putative cysteine protease